VGLSPVTFPDRDTAVAALKQGDVAALLAERSLVLEPLYKQPGFALTDARFTDRPICWVLPQGDSAYRDLVNLTLMWFQADGTYTELYRTWFDDPPLTLEVWPGSPAVPLSVQAP
jgi:ABC-type amino acid transport substrate-binding protein